MITIIHPVGQGDLGNDIVKLRPEERLIVQDVKLRRLRQQLDEADADVLRDRLLNTPPGERGRPGRFAHTPLALVLEALRGANAVVRVILLGTANGRAGTETDAVATLLEDACNYPDVKAGLEEHFGFPLVVEAYANGDLREQKCIDELRRWLDGDAGIADGEVIVSGIAGATAVVFAAMGLADQMGLKWRLAVAPEEGGDRAMFLDRSPNRAAPFYWLRSLGYTLQATEWAASEGAALPISEEALEETARLTATLDRVRDGQDRGGRGRSRCSRPPIWRAPTTEPAWHCGPGWSDVTGSCARRRSGASSSGEGRRGRRCHSWTAGASRRCWGRSLAKLSINSLALEMPARARRRGWPPPDRSTRLERVRFMTVRPRAVGIGAALSPSLRS
ncbi:hypothetical protein [Actinomyces procaprae]|uniref:hypothetical protein n=1 Tax=Actinomyces procaprae TaxID=2560010 RepID=UPI0010A2536F|nr:hypothetical protein [Actinomyces procaprae]